jgi:hypothetical protein
MKPSSARKLWVQHDVWLLQHTTVLVYLGKDVVSLGINPSARGPPPCPLSVAASSAYLQLLSASAGDAAYEARILDMNIQQTSRKRTFGTCW